MEQISPTLFICAFIYVSVRIEPHDSRCVKTTENGALVQAQSTQALPPDLKVNGKA